MLHCSFGCHFGFKWPNESKKIKNPRLKQLNLLLLGGTVMLVVDHLWNKELFLVGENILSDLLLGVAMTGAIFIFWWLLVLKDKRQALERQ